MRRLTLLLALLGAAGAGPPAAPPPAASVAASRPDSIGDSIYPGLGQAGLDVQHYDVTLAVDQPGTPGLRGQVTVTFTSTRPVPLLSLDYLGSLVLDVRWNDRPAPWQYDRTAGKLLVTPPMPLPAGVPAQVTVRFAGRPGRLPDPSLPFALGWQAVPGVLTQAGANYSFSEPDGTRTYLPVNDHPSDPATFTTRVTVPAGFTAAASGVLQSERAVTGGHEFVFTQAQPIPTYALGIHVNRFRRVDSPGVPVGPGGVTVQRRDYFPVGTTETIEAPYRQADRMLRVLSDWFGPYPFTAYGSAIITSRVPALETSTLTTMPVASSFEPVIVHEMAHQWFGDAVTLGDWADVWLNEGFATYAELLWAQAQGQDTQDMVDSWYERLGARPTRPLVARTETQLFDLTAYLRGALALHALRLRVGDEAFRAFLHTYVARYSQRPARTADLLALARQELGAGAAETLQLWVEFPNLPPKPTAP